jgi:hypothetical protein
MRRFLCSAKQDLVVHGIYTYGIYIWGDKIKYIATWLPNANMNAVSRNNTKVQIIPWVWVHTGSISTFVTENHGQECQKPMSNRNGYCKPGFHWTKIITPRILLTAWILWWVLNKLLSDPFDTWKCPCIWKIGSSASTEKKVTLGQRIWQFHSLDKKNVARKLGLYVTQNTKPRALLPWLASTSWYYPVLPLGIISAVDLMQ